MKVKPDGLWERCIEIEQGIIILEALIHKKKYLSLENSINVTKLSD